jgi:formate dehydrogenase maturation protein FdhE
MATDGGLIFEGKATPSADGSRSRTTIWKELDTWAKGLERWQRFIVATAVRDGQLNEDQLSAVYQLFLSDNKLGPVPDPLPEIPFLITGRAEDASLTPLFLDSIGNLSNINALPNTAGLTFGEGLTVVFGGNGTGKSGFARVLANACFSRYRPRILPNVYVSGTGTKPSADITVRYVSQTRRVIKFQPGIEDVDLRRIAVFDTSVARAHLAEESPIGFTPIGFDVFAEIIRVYGKIDNKLNATIQARQKVNTFTNSFLEPQSPISKAVAVLSADTNIATLKDQAVFGEKEQARLTDLDNQITDLKAKSAEQALKDIEEAKADVTTLRDRLKTALSTLEPAAKARYQAELDDFAKKTHQAMEASIDSFKSSHFKATGSDEWLAFIKSAHTLGLAEDAGYPKDGDRCLLCHRPLDEPSISLIRRFWNYLEGDARKAAADANDVLDKTVKALNDVKLHIFGEESRVRSHLNTLDSKLAQRVREAVTALAGDRDAVVAILETGMGTLSKASHEDLSADMGALLSRIETKIETLRTTDRDSMLKILVGERVTLRHRQVLSKLIDQIEEYIADEKWIKKARAVAKSALNTKAMTTKENELFGKVIEGTYRKQLESEFKTLDCRLPLELQTHGRGGKTKRWLEIKGGYKPIDILSEGEQRAVALADFLTEVGLNPAGAGIVLDDPVTSQDHGRKERITKRLINEARVRQTIILTHDLVFLTMLIEAADKADVPVTTHWMECDGNAHPGLVNLNECPANTSDYKTTKKAKATLEEAKKLSGLERVQAVQRGMGELRRTVEETIIQHLFKKVIQRWDERVMVGSLKKINWSNELADEIEKIFADLSRYIEGHSHSEAYVPLPPEPKDLEEMIARVDGLIKEARSDRQQSCLP